jgi:hypothetical protein
MRHDVSKTSGRGGNFVSGKGAGGEYVGKPMKADHEGHKSPFEGVGGKATTRKY